LSNYVTINKGFANPYYIPI